MPQTREQHDFELYSVLDAEDVRAKYEHVDKGLKYFEAKTGGKRFPNRADVQPSELKDILPEVCLFSLLYDDEGLFSNAIVQLMGTTVASFYGEITGLTVTEGAAPEVAERILVSCRRCVETRRPVYAETAALSDEKSHLKVGVLYVPLSEDGECIDRLFLHVKVSLRSGGIVCASEPN
ncbi:PAS domain-containing protein [Kordiimonas sp.]|uniref:PAS domain-containing protein n=1 Tax=Kordiimonas sp. TaxID=1970157 RepID=UPI003A93A9F1